MTTRTIRRAAALLLIPAVMTVLCGCEQTGTADTDFAPGAFPPTMSDMDYHRNSWTRADCLACHETGIRQSPPILHVSVPPLAKNAKCRTCHVFVAGSEPIK